MKSNVEWYVNKALQKGIYTLDDADLKDWLVGTNKLNNKEVDQVFKAIRKNQ